MKTGRVETLTYSSELIQNLNCLAKQIRLNVVKSIGVGVAGHLGGSCSAADIVTALYFYKMNHDPQNPHMKDRDRFLLSKGHAGILQYAALAMCGYFSEGELLTVKKLNSNLQGHPDLLKTPGVEAGTGSLGQGLSIGLGMALGLRMDELNSKVYVLLGDGEIAEGQIWEAAMAASFYQADNLVAILDKNGLQATGAVTDRFDTAPLSSKWESFGWNVIQIDGHDMAAILTALDQADHLNGRPTVIIAETIKGKGVSFAENNPSFHNAALSSEQYAQAIQELS